MCVILPALKSLEGGKAVFSLSVILDTTKVFPLRDFVLKFLIGSLDMQQIITGRSEYIPLPNVYCTMFALIFAGLFLTNTKIGIRKRAGLLALLIILFLSFYIKGLYLIWHGFNEPTWFPFRFSFLFSFLVLYAGWEGFCNAEKQKLRHTVICVLAICGVYTILMIALKNREYSFLSTDKLVISICAILAEGVIALLYLRTRKLRYLYTAVLLVCTELGLNGVYSLGSMNYADYTEYQAFVEETEPAVDYVKETDDSFYRMEKTYSRKESDPMLLNYRGLSHYSSTEKGRTKYFMGQLGFRYNGNWSYYNRGSTYAADSLLGVKYICSKKKLGSPYQLLDTIGDVKIYQNPYALSIGFLANEEILSVSMENNQKFEYQNELWSAIDTETDSDLFVPETVEDVQLTNLKTDAENPHVYRKIDTSETASLTYTFTAGSDNPVFAWFGTEDMQTSKIKVNGKSLGKYFNTYQYDIIRLGSFQKGETVTVEIIPKKDYVNVTDVWIYYQDMEVMQQYYDNISEGNLELTSDGADDRISGTITNSFGKEYLLFTIPADEGWHAYVDGVETDIETAMEIFIAVKVPEGEHQIELRFIPKGLKTGLMLSLLSACMTGLWLLYRKKSRIPAAAKGKGQAA